MARMERRGGFAWVEIMIVVSIIGLPAAMAIPSFIKARAIGKGWMRLDPGTSRGARNTWGTRPDAAWPAAIRA